MRRTSADLLKQVRELGREFVIQASGRVLERVAKNDKIATGDIEILVESLVVLNPAKLPPF